MKNLAKVLTLLLALALICGTLAIIASAEGGPEAKIGSQEYDTIADAVAAVPAEGATITLAKDATVAAEIPLQYNVTIDLNGHTLTTTTEVAFSTEASIAFNIIGNGTVVSNGTIFKSTSAAIEPTFSMIGSANTTGIKIDFLATTTGTLVGMANGNATVKNVSIDVKSFDASAGYANLFDTLVTATPNAAGTLDYSANGVDWVFDAVDTVTPAIAPASSNYFFADAVNKGTITFKNSFLRGSMNVFGVGLAKADNVTDNVLVVENSIVIIDGYAPAMRPCLVNGYPETLDENLYGTYGNVYIKDSYMATRVRTFTGTKGCLGTSTVIVDNSEIVVNGNLGKDTNHQLSRGFAVEFINGSKWGTIVNGGVHSWDASTFGAVSLELGTRTSKPSKIDAKVTIPEGAAWVYDPAGNPDYPYVLAAGAVEGAVPAPDYVIFSNLEDVRAKTNTKWGEDTVTVGKNIVARNNASEDLNQGTWAKIQWDVKKGTAYIVTGSDGNRYVEYVVDTKQDSDPYFIPGGGLQGGQADAQTFVSDAVSGQVRRKVIVASADFATNGNGYPDMNFSAMARYGTSGSGNNSSKSLNIQITDKGKTIKNTLYDAREVHLNPEGQWNNVTMVAYSDPGYVGYNNFGGICYVYVNGEYVGNTYFYNINSTYADWQQNYFQGIRFNIAKQDANNTVLQLDNMTLRAYNEYAGATERDSSALGAQDGVHTPEIYVAKYGVRYVTAPFSVAGVPYSDINEAIKAAAASGSVVELNCDVNTPTVVTEDGTVVTNGYKLNLSEDSNAAKVETDANGNAISYEFKELYNAYYLNFYWLIEGREINSEDDGDYTITPVNVGRTPKAPYTFAAVPNWENGTVDVQVGWSRDFSDEAWDFVPVTLGEAGTDGYEFAIMNPVFETRAMTSYVKNAEGYVSYQTSAAESFSAYQDLKDGQTLVLLADMPVKQGTQFDNDDAQYTGGVTIDGDYTAEELATMREASVKIAVDLNGFKMINDTAGINIAKVGRNTTLTVYSSKPGAEIFSAFNSKNNDGYFSNGQRMFTIYNGGGEDFNSHDAVYNGHIVIGTYGEYPGSNLTLKGGVILEGLTGDNSTSIEADGLTMICVSPTSGGSIMTRYYSGDIIVTNSLVVSPNKAEIIDMKSYYTSGNKPSDMADETSGRSDTRIATPYVYFENCILINTAAENSAIIGNNGDGLGVCLVFKNVYTTGRLNPSNISSYRVRAYENVASTNFALADFNLINSDITIANYNKPFTLNEFGIKNTDANILKVDMHVVDKTTGAISTAPYYIVTAGNESLVTEEGAVVRVIGNLNKGTALKTDVVTVTYAGLTADAEPAAVVNYLKGAPYSVDDVVPADVVLGATKLVFDGTWSAAPEFVTENVTLTPGVTVKANIEGVLANLSIYSDFNVNLFVPIAYKDAITSIAVGETVLATAEVDMDGDGVADYIKVTYKRACNEANTNVVFTITVGDVACTATVNIAEYAKTILAGEAYTAEDKQLMYYMAAYANEAYKYFGDGTADETLAGILTTYESAKGEYVADETYANAIADTKLGDAFASATIDLASAPRFVLTLKDGFAGTVTVTYGPNTFTKTVTATDDRVIVIDGMKAYNFIVTLDVTAEGTIGETAVTVAGNYNLDTFVKYHADNAATNEDSAKCLALLKAFYDYVTVANAYKA